MQKFSWRFILFCLISCTMIYADEINNIASRKREVVDSAQSDSAIGGMLLQAVSLMGISYRWGGNSPETGMDCSGFIRYVFKKSLGITLPRTAGEMSRLGKRIKLSEMEPGDLIFFNTARGSNTHLGMYVGKNKFIQSPKTGSHIQITELKGYWQKHINGVKRIVQENIDDNGESTLENYQYINNQGLPSHSVRSKYNHDQKHKTSKKHEVKTHVPPTHKNKTSNHNTLDKSTSSNKSVKSNEVKKTSQKHHKSLKTQDQIKNTGHQKANKHHKQANHE